MRRGNENAKIFKPFETADDVDEDSQLISSDSVSNRSRAVSIGMDYIIGLFMICTGFNPHSSNTIGYANYITAWLMVLFASITLMRSSSRAVRFAYTGIRSIFYIVTFAFSMYFLYGMYSYAHQMRNIHVENVTVPVIAHLPALISLIGIILSVMMNRRR